MSEFNISVPGGVSKRLKTGGKYCPADIVVTAEGSAPVLENDVNFYDYDGTLLYAYTLAQLQSLTELPPLPSHNGLICQGWNWTLEDLKTYAKPYDVMPFYVTEDGATWYDLVNDTGRNITVTFRWRQYVGHDLPVLDFGDGSETTTVETISDGAVVSCSHTYAPGTYRAKLSGFYHIGEANAVSDIVETRSILLKHLFIGEYPQFIYAYAFRNCVRLETVTMTPRSSVAAGGQAFASCFNLKALPLFANNGKLPSSIVLNAHSLKVLSLTNGIAEHNGISACRSLRRLCLPDTTTAFKGIFADNASLTYTKIPAGTTSIPNNAYLRNSSITRIEIPESVTSIGSSAFGSCESLHVLRFNSATPPTVANANAFSGIPASCVVEIPTGSLSVYQNETNYSTIAAQMVEV